MSIEAIGAIGANAEVDSLLAPAAVQQPAGDFATWFAQEVGAVNTSLVKSESDIQRLAAGESQSLHQVMMHMEEAKLSFQLLAQVRNRLLDAYQEVMRMQV
jgi:flagellar hook-basal body complex protein FliE